MIYQQVQNIQWKELTFTHRIERRDSGRERDFSYYLIPPQGHTNRFRIIACGESVRFFIGSSLGGALDAMSVYFSKCFGAFCTDSEPVNVNGRTLAYKVGRISVKAKEAVDQGFVRSIAYVPMAIPGITLSYDVIVVSAGKGRRPKFSFLIIVSMSGEERLVDAAETVLKIRFNGLKATAGMFLRLRKGRKVTLSGKLLGTPFKLVTFVGVPTDEGLN